MKKLQPKKEAYRKICLDKIIIGSNVRLNYDTEKIKELAESIKIHGLLEPIIAEEYGDKYLITSGHRRFIAVKYLYNDLRMDGFFEIECIIKPVKNRIAVQLIENIQREDLTGAELEKAVKELIETHGYTQKEAGKILGKSEPWISSILKACNFRISNPEAEKLNTGAVQEIARLPEEKQKEAIKHTIEKGGTVKAAREAKKKATERSRANGNDKKENSERIYSEKKDANGEDPIPKNEKNRIITCPHCGKEVDIET